MTLLESVGCCQFRINPPNFDIFQILIMYVVSKTNYLKRNKTISRWLLKKYIQIYICITVTVNIKYNCNWQIDGSWML